MRVRAWVGLGLLLCGCEAYRDRQAVRELGAAQATLAARVGEVRLATAERIAPSPLERMPSIVVRSQGIHVSAASSLEGTALRQLADDERALVEGVEAMPLDAFAWKRGGPDYLLTDLLYVLERIQKLQDRLSRTQGGRAARLYLDAATPFDALLAVAYTADSAGFDQLNLSLHSKGAEIDLPLLMPRACDVDRPHDALPVCAMPVVELSSEGQLVGARAAFRDGCISLADPYDVTEPDPLDALGSDPVVSLAGVLGNEPKAAPTRVKKPSRDRPAWDKRSLTSPRGACPTIPKHEPRDPAALEAALQSLSQDVPELCRSALVSAVPSTPWGELAPVVEWLRARGFQVRFASRTVLDACAPVPKAE